ncbi:MAG: hypothetical protein FWG87_08865 [Defluviitaleaceae bacterium]|nr:hypothetical protein [Defluviitaleaceae bacterium]
MERGFSRIWRIYADFKNIKHGFTQITRILSDVSDFRGFSHEPIRVIRENPLNPCLIAFKSVRYCLLCNVDLNIAFVKGICRFS